MPTPEAQHTIDTIREARAATLKIVETQLQQKLAEAEAEYQADYDKWESLASGQDTEEAEISGQLEGVVEGLNAALLIVTTEAAR